LNYLNDKLYDFFSDNEKNEEEFEKWHKKVCNEFLGKYNSFLNEKGINKLNNVENQEFGKAQKVVNMTLKYISCYKNVKDGYFKYCHMPLDVYTLEWFRNKFEKEKIGPNNIVWTKMEYGSEDSKYSYLWVYNKIKKYAKENEITPLELEFLVWNEHKIIELLDKIEQLKIPETSDGFLGYIKPEKIELMVKLKEEISKNGIYK